MIPLSPQMTPHRFVVSPTTLPAGLFAGDTRVSDPADEVEVEGLWVQKHELLDGGSGTEVLATSHAFLRDAPLITVEWRIVLPDGDSPEILRVDRYSDAEDQVTVVYFKG